MLTTKSVTRTTDRNQLQLVILKNLCSGILPFGPPHSSISYDPTFHDSSLILPQSWVKGAMLLRLNSLLRGHSGCRWILINGLHQLLVHDLVPCAPLRQSISASGDLAPLGYIAASLTENVAVKVWSGKGYVCTSFLLTHLTHTHMPLAPTASLSPPSTPSVRTALPPSPSAPRRPSQW